MPCWSGAWGAHDWLCDELVGGVLRGSEFPVVLPSDDEWCSMVHWITDDQVRVTARSNGPWPTFVVEDLRGSATDNVRSSETLQQIMLLLADSGD